MSSHKLIFKEVHAKNFRSISNTGMTLRLDKSPTTLICSEDNGAGKSTLAVHALYYCLFDKSYDKANKKTSLVNSHNNKDCLVEVQFDTKGKTYVVRRGMKPSVFEIHEDGVLIESEAARGDHQKYLESILGFDEKVFENTIALGKERFVPFASMSAAERRNYSEQVLDLVIITKMNEETKLLAKNLTFEKSNLEYNLEKIEEKIKYNQNTIDLVSESIKNKQTEVQSNIDGIDAEIADINQRFSEKSLELGEKIDGLGLLKATTDREKQFSTITVQLQTEMNNVKGSIARFESLGECPTCKQNVTEEHKELCTKDKKVELVKLEEAVEQASTLHQETKDTLEGLNRIVLEAQEIKRVMQDLQTQITVLSGQKNSFENMMKDEGEQAKIDAATAIVIEQTALLIEERKKLDDINISLLNTQHLLLALKDDGVKAQIVQEYLPFLNEKINQYLDKMNLYVNIKIDSEFELEMYSPDRKGQTLGSLSTGQLRRIDLAVLFAWRAIAQAKASIDCNLLILDEILENLSETGVQDFMEFYNNEFGNEGMNLIAISQRNAEFSEYFENEIMYKLTNGFTEQIA